MLREEFENLLGPSVVKPNDACYQIIEYVYNWHPCNFSKEAIASLYSEFGMCIIYDLLPRSQMAMEHDNKVEVLRRAANQAAKRYEEATRVNLKSKEALSEWLKEQN